MKKLFGLIALYCISGCSNNHPIDLNGKTNADAAHLETVKIERGQLSSEIKLPGQLKPFERVDIYPKVNGFVKDIYVDRGSMVQQGQLLMTLDAPEVEHQFQSANDRFLQAQENLNGSRDKYMRLKIASKKPGAISQLELISAESKFQADSAFEQSEMDNVKAVQAMRDYLVVKAPFAGVITERNVHPGNLTGPGFKMDNKPLLVLQDNQKMRLEVSIPEQYVENLNLSDGKISFTTAAVPGKVFTATISRKAKALNDSYRSEAVEADVINTGDIFMPGMYVEAKLNISGNGTSYLVPSTAVLTSTEKRYVITNNNGAAAFIEVTTGVTADGKTEVFGNFTGNEMIIVKPTVEMRNAGKLK